MGEIFLGTVRLCMLTKNVKLGMNVTQSNT